MRPILFSSLALLVAAPAAVLAQASNPIFNAVDPIAFDTSGPVIRAHAEPLKPFTVAGERGVLVGQQDGTFEAWLLPVKVLSHLTIEANVDGYTVPIDVNQQAAGIEVRPDRTTITYSHLAFTVRQIMFSPPGSIPGASAQTGPVILFEFDCLHPTGFTFRFTPELRWMWPERNEGVPGAEWVAPGPNAYERAGGFYVLHSDYPDFAAAVTIPGARPGIMAPYQERPRVYPVELKLHIDPVRDQNKLFPLLMAVGTDHTAANSANLAATLEKLNAAILGLYESQSKTYKDVLANSVSVETPDKTLNEAFQWAVISIEQLKTKTRGLGTAQTTASSPGSANADPEETALVAGYFDSADSARPGFGWFFGRDALYTLYAVNGYGNFALSKSELEFLMRRQRPDGKIMHEWSQTAGAIDWQAFPYMYAAADATPLFLLAMLDYVRASGDTAFLTAHRDAIEKAWAFETSHAPGPDQGGNGIYDNTQGTGWVESWPGGLPRQEVYLALLDQQASAAMARIEDLLQDKQKSAAAQQRSETIRKTIDAQFYDQEKNCYAFSRNANGSLDRTSTVYPALAWWTSPSVTGNSQDLAHPDACLRQFADASLNTDWGLRDVSNQEKMYDGMSYHQGSVWPLFTGWAALAEYRGNQPLAGYQMLMENANLTRAQDLGAHTELLSGDFFVPFGRSTSHQLWSSAMVITPTLRGLFGIDIDAQTKTITVNPHLPAYWSQAAIRNLPLPGGSTDLTFLRDGANLRLSLSPRGPEGWRLRSDIPGATPDRHDANVLVLPLSAVEIGDTEHQSPIPGARTGRFRVLSEEWGTNQVKLAVEGLAGTVADLPVRRHKLVKMKLQAADGLSNIADQDHPGVSLSAIDSAFRDMNLPFAMEFHFPQGEGWKTITVTLTW
jgi:glycogen debranching enzyme